MKSVLAVWLFLLTCAVLVGVTPWQPMMAWAEDASDDDDDDDDDDDTDDDDNVTTSGTTGAAPVAAPASPAPAGTTPTRTAPADGTPTRTEPSTPEATTNRDAPAPVRAIPLPRSTPKLTYGRDSANRKRSGELSAARLTSAQVSALQRAGFGLIRRHDARAIGQGIVARLTTPQGVDPQRALREAQRLVPSGVFDLSHIYEPTAVAYGRGLVGMPLTRACLSGGRVGIIDSAVTAHPSLRGVSIRNKAFSAGQQDAMHGTAVLSVLAGTPPSGASPVRGTQLYVASVFAMDGRDPIADVIDLVAAVSWQVQNRVPVVNMSLSGPDNVLLREAVRGATRAGTVIVAAAGNGGANGAPRYPGAYPETIAVSAVDARGRSYRYNSRGSYVDVAAPGVDVWGAHAGTGGDALWTGTSFAVPFVTLELAAAHRSGHVRNINDARAYLAANARDIGPRGRDRQFGYGLLQNRSCR